MQARPLSILRPVLGAAAVTAVAAAPVEARAGEGGGSRQVCGGGHMSSSVSDPRHGPRPLHSQRLGTGQILGTPMLHERAGAALIRRPVEPHWASGTARRRRPAR